MSIIRKLGAVTLAGSLATIASMVAAPTANAAPGATVCAVVGSVSLSGIHINPLIPSSGGYSFGTTVLACAGSLTGIGPASSGGGYSSTAGQLDSFSGGVSAGPFTLGGTCSGGVSGVRVGAVVAGLLSLSCGGTLTGSGTTVAAATVLTFEPDGVDISNPTDPIINHAQMQGVAAGALL